jgi:hypothetical protein
MVLELRQRDPKPLLNVVKGNVYVYTPLLLQTYYALYNIGYGHHI